MPVVHACATDKSPHHFGRVVAQLLEKRLFREITNLRIQDIRQDQILADSDSHFSATVNSRETRDFEKLTRVHPTHRDHKPYIVETPLLLNQNANMIRIPLAPFILARRQKRPIGTPLEFTPESLHAPVLNQKNQASLGAGFTKAPIPENEDDVATDLHSLFGTDKEIQRRSDAVSS